MSLPREEKLYHYRAKIVDVFDGDSLTAIVSIGFYVQITQKFRLLGINAPEKKGKTKKQAIASRDYLRSLVLGKDVIIQTVKDNRNDDKDEKYGRFLAYIWTERDGQPVCVNVEMVNQGYAKRYMEDGTLLDESSSGI